jgi:hypothetical protein
VEMETFYKFASENPWLTFFLAVGIGGVIKRTYRMLMVLTRGWPPEHLDADGDWRAFDGIRGEKNGT